MDATTRTVLVEYVPLRQSRLTSHLPVLTGWVFYFVNKFTIHIIPLLCEKIHIVEWWHLWNNSQSYFVKKFTLYHWGFHLWNNSQSLSGSFYLPHSLDTPGGVALVPLPCRALSRGADERGKLVKNFTMSNDCLCEIIHKRNLYSAWQLCEIIHNLGYRGVCLPVPEVGHDSKPKPINSLSSGAV